MSTQNLARRTVVGVSINGTDVTNDIQSYLLSCTYTDAQDGEVDDLQLELQDRDGNWLQNWLTGVLDKAAEGESGGLSISAVIMTRNWSGAGGDDVLECGTFEVDSIQAAGPPSVVPLKATAAPFTTAIRQTKMSRNWESYNLRGIATEIASSHGMSCLYEAAQNPYYSRVEQFQTGNIEFLYGLCRSAGISVKVYNGMIILFDQAAYERRNVIKTIRCKDGTYEKYKLTTGKADTEYTSCRVSYTRASGEYIEAIAYVEDYEDGKDSNQQLEVTAACTNTGEALRLAEKHLRLHNKFQRQATFTLPGNTTVASGATVQLNDFGLWSGKYIIEEAKHSVSRKGYTTQIKMRAALEGY